MKYYNGDMSKEQFLNYVEAHSQTDRALFSKEMVAELLYLCGDPNAAKSVYSGIKSWYSADLRDYVDEIRKKPANLT